MSNSSIFLCQVIRWSFLQTRRIRIEKMDSDSDISTTESVCSSNCTIESVTDVKSCTSQSSDSENRSFPWPIAKVPVVADVDFGSLPKNYGPPLLIRFYHNVCGRPVTHIIDFYEVPLAEAVRALNAQHDHKRYLNLIVRFDSCGEEDISAFLPVLRLLLFRCQINFTVPKWERCVLIMSDYKFGKKVVEVMAEFTNTIFELNIGSVQHIREQRHRTDPKTEANYIVEILQVWLSRCCGFLRCLRLFAFVEMDVRLSMLIAKCPFLSHISLCRVSGIECPVFNGIKSFEFNGCGMAYTDQDLQVAKSVVKCFPNLRIIAFQQVCFEPVMASLIRHLKLTGRQFELYQMIALQQFASLVKSTFVVKSGNDGDCIELLNKQYGTYLLVYGSRSVYHTPL